MPQRVVRADIPPSQTAGPLDVDPLDGHVARPTVIDCQPLALVASVGVRLHDHVHFQARHGAVPQTEHHAQRLLAGLPGDVDQRAVGRRNFAVDVAVQAEAEFRPLLAARLTTTEFVRQLVGGHRVMGDAPNPLQAGIADANELAFAHRIRAIRVLVLPVALPSGNGRWAGFAPADPRRGQNQSGRYEGEEPFPVHGSTNLRGSFE